MAGVASMAGAWFIHWPVRPVWPMRGLYGPICIICAGECSAVAEIGAHRLAIIDMDRKLRGCAPLGERELGPHLTQCRLGRGLPPYQVVSRSIQPFGHNKHGARIGG